MVDFGDIIGGVIGRAGRSVDNPYGGVDLGFPPAPVSLESAISTIPPGSATPRPKSYLADLPDFSLIKTKAQAEQAIAGAARTLHIWKTRLAQEINKVTGAEALAGPPSYDFDTGEYFDFDGNVIDKAEHDRLKKLWIAQEAASKDRQQSPWESEIRTAIAEIESYAKTIDEQMPVLPEDPKEKEPTGPGTQKDPIKIGLNQFMAALAGQESSSGYRPTWASAQITQGFGPTTEQLDAGYTDDNGVWHPNFNKGLDYGLPTGTPIDAAVGGTVISAGDSGDGWGISVKIRDDNGLIHNYGHLDSADVTPGERIGAGVIIGKSGNTGKSTGQHLSYDVYDANGRFKDPTPFVSGGGYDTVNSDSGATGRFQIMPENWPSWSAEAGLPPGSPMSPENQELVAAYKLNEYYEMALGDWSKVARMWYAGPGSLNYTEEELNRPQVYNGQTYPSINEYVGKVMGRLSTMANNTGAGYQLPDGTWVVGSGGGSSGGGSTYDPVKAKQDKEDRDYEIFMRQLGFEQDRAGEVDRRYDDVSQRMKDYLSAAGASNDLLADIASALGNEARLVEMNQGIQDDAIATAANVNAAVQAGKLNYRDAMAGPIWSNSLMPIQKELEAVRAALQTAPPGFADSILRTIPKSVPMPYEVTDILDLPGYEGEYWGSPSTKRYGEGTIPRYATGTVDWRDEPYIAVYNSGGRVDSAILRRLRAAGAIDGGTEPTGTTPGTTIPDQVIPANANATYRPGYIPRNATLPPDLRVFDDGEWLDAAVSKAIMMISSGNSSFASAWGLGDLTPYHGMPASNFDGGVVQALRAGILANKDAPAVIATFGQAPGIPTVWVPDPANPQTANPGGAANTRTSGTGFQGNPGQTATYGGTYGGMDPYDSARIALEKEQLALQREIALAQQKLDQDRFALEQQQFGSQQEYQAAQIRWNDAKAALDEKNFLLQQTQAQLQERIFEDSIRRYEIETGMAREQLDLSKIRQEADLAYQARQLELQVEAGQLSREEYEEKKRQFELTFNYQKEKDQKALDIERAKTTVEYLSNPKDAVRSQFWYASQADPVGTAYDLFTGEDRGQKTYTQAYNEDANMFMEAMKPYKQYANGSDAFVRDVAAILGDSAKSNRATGFEEVIYNPTGAPIMVLSNEISRELGFVPSKGKRFGAHVREGRVS